MANEMSDWNGRLEQIKRRGECACGQKHSQTIEAVSVGPNALDYFGKYIADLGWSSLAIVADENTSEVGSTAVRACLPKQIDAQWIILKQEREKILVPDENAVGRLLMDLRPQCSGVVALGSGTIHDLVRYVSSRLGLPFVGIPTAPSMDGYASSVAPLHIGSFKKTFTARAPQALFADTRLLSTAPKHMVGAGFGDIVGKITARFDWRMAHLVTGEYYCTYPLELMDQAVGTCLANTRGIGEGSPAMIEALTEALILSGISIMLTGNSRPASGPEHLLAHYWEVQSALAGSHDDLHGTKVGVATPICVAFIKEMFSRASDDLRPVSGIDSAARERLVRQHYGAAADEVVPEASAKWLDSGRLVQIQRSALETWTELQRLAASLPEPEHLIEQLRLAKGASSTVEIGISRDQLHQALLFSREMRSRFTVFDLAFCLGVLDEVAEQIANEYGG